MSPINRFRTLLRAAAHSAFLLLRPVTATAQPSVTALDSLALVALYNATDGPNWTNNSGWLTAPVLEWYGVSEDIRGRGRIGSVALANNNLRGPLPEEIARAYWVEDLDLSHNQLTGSLPDFRGPSLSNLDLSHNQLTGTLPGSLSTHDSLRLNDNQGLTGTIPLNFLTSRAPTTLDLSNTSLCAPDDPRFQEWLSEIADVSVNTCVAPPRDPVGTCETSIADAYIYTNNVRARLPLTGGLFYRGEPHVYQVPRFSNSNAIFNATVLLGGLVDRRLHTAATKYGPWEMWPGPLPDHGAAPGGCADFDRFFRITRAEIETYEATGVASENLKDWPTGLGAPTVDAGGNAVDLVNRQLSERVERKIDLGAGERPDFLGEEAVWWIMNDRGNLHESSNYPPLGVEVQAQVFAARTAVDAINNTTFYRYRIVNRNDEAIESTYFGLHVDPDLGDAADDYVGSDSVRGIAFVYNADNFDGGGEGYGTPPPALGIEILRGPLADDDGVDNDRDGAVDEPGERPGLSHFQYFWGGGGVNEEPGTGAHYYNYMQSRWKSGERVTVGRYGYNGFGDPGSTDIPTNYFYPGDPVTGAFWSEFNIDGLGTPSWNGDRRFILSSGPFNLESGEAKDIVFAIVWAKGKDNLDSVTELKKASEEVRAAFESGLENLPAGLPPQSSPALVAPANGATGQPTDPTLVWEALADAGAYEIEIRTGETVRSITTFEPIVQVDSLAARELLAWRVRGVSIHGKGPWSSESFFRTGDASFLDHRLVFDSFTATANADGPLDPPDMAAFGFNSSGFPEVACEPGSTSLCDRPTVGYQQSMSDATWGIHAGGATRYYGPLDADDSFLGLVTRKGESVQYIRNQSFEIRFTDGGGKAVHDRGNGSFIDVPFELWNVGVHSQDDPSDDYRMIPGLCEAACGAGSVQGVFDIGGDHPVSGGSNDPYSDWITWYDPPDKTPGAAGYEAYFSGAAERGEEVMTGMVLVAWNGGSERPYTAELPENGTVFRIAGQDAIAPRLAAPGNRTTLQASSVRFYWNAYDGDVIRLQVSRQADFSDPLEISGAASGEAVPFTESGFYYWRVRGSNGVWSEAWLFTLDATATGTAEQEENVLPDQVALFDNYPNPFNPSTTLMYELPEAMDVTLEVFDMLGRRVSVLERGRMAAGRHRVAFDAAGLSSGVYVYVLGAGGVHTTRKMILLR